ncbi:MAG: hypothetical protein AAGF07_05430 [Patescibacteria group bacterium]
MKLFTREVGMAVAISAFATVALSALTYGFKVSAGNSNKTYTIKESNKPQIVLETDWGTENPYNFKIAEVRLPKPELRLVSNSEGEKQRVLIVGSASPKKYDVIVVRVIARCNKSQECLGKSNGHDAFVTDVDFKLEHIAINLADSRGREKGRIWHDDESVGFIGHVSKFKGGDIGHLSEGWYNVRQNFFGRINVRRAKIPLLNLSNENNTGIHGPWSNIVELN